ncbi:MAG TPA: alpha/beta hydrolase [Chthonomonas sp.]|jgi:acetyl esterase/lipase|uniref:alpha/beta hydrolase n=1 Tax=Chthonomonas sp. TaxID=2282153 RepID=UPI002B4AB50B|nr:alpha/beta hydrolase [Chthonomonas sp.]HLH81439.1 alpha/beta hydrolase [Chthonomonas sp.]
MLRRQRTLVFVAVVLALVFSKPAVWALPQAASDDVRVQKNVPYGEVDGVKLLMDVYLPKTVAGKHPGIVLVHGGAWIGGDKIFYANIGKAFAKHGYDAFSVNYRLAPKFHYPAQLDDVQRAVRFLRAHAADYDLDPQRIGAMGDSAGGYLVAFLGLCDTRDNSDPTLANYSSKVQCVVDFYGPTDFTIPPEQAHLNAFTSRRYTISPSLPPGHQTFETHLDTIVTNILTMFLGKKPGEDPALYREASPVVYASKAAPPFLILQGTADTLVPPDQSERLYDALHKAGANVTLLLAYGLPHAFLSPQPDLYFDIAEGFFDRYLKP